MPTEDTHPLSHTPQIKVKTLTGKEIDIDIETDDTIARIKVPHARALPFEKPVAHRVHTRARILTHLPLAHAPAHPPIRARRSELRRRRGSRRHSRG
jgi:hypothetical protein